jgi:hypothetical protein
MAISKESVPRLPKEVRIKNQTTWRTSDLVRVFEEARRWLRYCSIESDPKFLAEWRQENLDRATPDEIVFRSASAATAQYYVDRSEYWYDLFTEKPERAKGVRWTMYLPANRIVATEMLRVLDTSFGNDSPENLRTIVQRLRRLAGGKALTDQAFIIQHKNRKKRVYHGRRIRTAG